MPGSIKMNAVFSPNYYYYFGIYFPMFSLISCLCFFLLSCSRWLSLLLESIRTEIRKVYVFDLLSVTLLYACTRHVSHTKSFCIVFHYIYIMHDQTFSGSNCKRTRKGTRHWIYRAVCTVYTYTFYLNVWIDNLVNITKNSII